MVEHFASVTSSQKGTHSVILGLRDKKVMIVKWNIS